MYKGIILIIGEPLQTDYERSEIVKHCKWVDEVISPCPWIITPEFLAKHKIDYVVHDDNPYKAPGSEDIYAPIKKMGKFIPSDRTKGISTTDIFAKII
jgi:choline-phosphate cytidylyltransferase